MQTSLVFLLETEISIEVRAMIYRPGKLVDDLRLEKFKEIKKDEFLYTTASIIHNLWDQTGSRITRFIIVLFTFNRVIA